MPYSWIIIRPELLHVRLRNKSMLDLRTILHLTRALFDVGPTGHLKWDSVTIFCQCFWRTTRPLTEGHSTSQARKHLVCALRLFHIRFENNYSTLNRFTSDFLSIPCGTGTHWTLSTLLILEFDQINIIFKVRPNYATWNTATECDEATRQKVRHATSYVDVASTWLRHAVRCCTA